MPQFLHLFMISDNDSTHLTGLYQAVLTFNWVNAYKPLEQCPVRSKHSVLVIIKYLVLSKLLQTILCHKASLDYFLLDPFLFSCAVETSGV